MHHMFYGNGIFRWLMSFMHLAIPILAIYILFKILNGRGGSCNHRKEASPLYILKGRYAKGEISRDEFQRMKDEIRD